MHKMAPPAVPSHVFLGEIFVSGVLPISEPTIYAMVSFIQIEAIRIMGSTSPEVCTVPLANCIVLAQLRISIIKAHASDIYTKPKNEKPNTFMLLRLLSINS